MGGSGAGRLAVLEQGVVDAALLSVPENIIAVNKGYNELIFLGDVVSFPQNGFGTSVTRIQQQPDEVYRMVRATLRGLLFVTDDANRDQARDIMMKQWRVSDHKLAGEMLGFLKRGLAKDAVISPQAVQYFVDETSTSRSRSQGRRSSTLVSTELDRLRGALAATESQWERQI
jgi:ABC-type nitrate/sulfonate/bicarbonate transport system substrate-binding protein